MIRVFLACLVCLAAGTFATAQPKPLPKPDPTIRLTLRPAAAPVPALKYHLLPDLNDQTPGNAVVLYYRAFSPEWQVLLHRPEVAKLLEKWSEHQRQKPAKGLEWTLQYTMLKEVDSAARREYCDWEITPRLRKEGISLLLPDIQAIREFARLLAIRARLEMDRGQFDKATYTLQTGYAMARHAAEHPILISALVGVAAAAQMNTQLEELIQTPGSPNLYWALTDLPSPFIDLRKNLQGERLWLEAMVPGLREALADLHSGPLSAQQLQTMQDQLANVLEDKFGNAPATASSKLLLVATIANMYPEAKQFLLAQGRAPELVEKLPMLQVVLLAELATYYRFFDDMLKWNQLPFWQASKGVRQAEHQLVEAHAHGTGRMRFSLAGMFLPAIYKVEQSKVRLDRRLAALRCIEALRLHAAAHTGQWPAALDEITEVPLPTDPFTGKPFEYRREGPKAVLSGAPLDGKEMGAQDLRYELTLTK
jgi:hypothetical protein